MVKTRDSFFPPFVLGTLERLDQVGTRGFSPPPCPPTLFFVSVLVGAMTLVPFAAVCADPCLPCLRSSTSFLRLPPQARVAVTSLFAPQPANAAGTPTSPGTSPSSSDEPQEELERMVFARRAAARRREEEKRKEEEAEALEEDGGDNVFVWAGKAVGGWVGGLFGGGRGKEEAGNEVERMRAPSLLMEEKEVAESIAAGEGEAGKEGGAWGVFSFFFPLPRPPRRPLSPILPPEKERRAWKAATGKAKRRCLRSRPPLQPRRETFRDCLPEKWLSMGGSRGAWEWTVVAQGPPELSGLPSRPPFLPPQDWYLARASEKMAPISPTSPPIPSYWEDKAGEEGEEGTSLASAGSRLLLQDAGGLGFLVRGLTITSPPNPDRAQALETLCRLLRPRTKAPPGASTSPSSGASSFSGKGGDVEEGNDRGRTPYDSDGEGEWGESEDEPNEESSPGGVVMAALTEDKDMELALIRVLLSLVEEPLGISVSRLTGLGRSHSSIEELRCQRAAIYLLYTMCLASERAIEALQTEGRLIPALQQILRERLFEEGPMSVYHTIHKLLSIVGYHEWKPRQAGQKGLRILSLDGGGTRGVMTIALLSHLIEATGKEVHELFDIICGNSTGGILAALFAVKATKVKEAGRLYDELIKKIFNKSPAPLAYSNLVLRTAQYNENVWEDVLKVLIGETLLIDTMGGPQGLNTPKFFVLSSVLSCNPAKLFMWRNYNYRRAQRSRYEGDFRAKVREAIRATTAAPTYFYPLVRGGMVHSDGALLANNPTAIAIHEAKIIYPNVPIEAVVSVGTGNVLEPQPVEGFGWAPIFNQIINSCHTSITVNFTPFPFFILPRSLRFSVSATNTEAVHDSLADFLPQDRYYRFNPNIENVSIDEVGIRPEKLAYLKATAKEYFQDPRNKERLDQLIKLLQPKKSTRSPLASTSSGPSSSPSSSPTAASSRAQSTPTEGRKSSTATTSRAMSSKKASSLSASPKSPPNGTPSSSSSTNLPSSTSSSTPSSFGKPTRSSQSSNPRTAAV
ncbi:calcium-independent phospholipase a2-gamma [Nannochloropsis gaditana CCMP526]|uniref:calcium-independent phospholipase a2-gamma n=1 Tax=Nannochloropsis gaditana (strain CCMP526) TaxID=1093141 RepID=UPI00029F785D|nr:calcium-independent phospholipase a2-gamma [Nannochloropsis gaditana CCMP526]EKU21866.1 calcium-independent phospholipase a2-gamma [Nannochloropsis gaditana CCMP526]|eukprot:XP_005854494.1 calcium-independent phospholipase a2-gamma [Nannochloropsis gaditana CCMP526]